MKNQKKLFLTYFVMICALILTTISTAQAATFTVNVDTDQKDLVPGDGMCAAAYRTCTLRAAIEEANVLPGDDVIVFSDSFKAPNAPKTIFLTLGQLHLQSAIEIKGPGARQLMIDGNHTTRVFFTGASQKNMSIAKLTIQNGYSKAQPFLSFAAGVWHANGHLRLEEVTVRDNYTMNEDPLLGEAGGGIYNGGGMQIISSTVSGNKGGYGGGIYNNGTLVVWNSTISGNATQQKGGAILNLDYAYIANSTIVNNTAQVEGGGIWNHNASELFFYNTIIANNNAPLNDDVNGTVNSHGNNLVENRGNSVGYLASDLPNGTNPILGSLQNNGGQTDTHALLPGSPAINAGNNCPYNNATVCLEFGGTDQRGQGFPRKISTVDIGSFEFQGRNNGFVKISGKVLKPNGRGLNKAVVTLTGSDGRPRSVETDQHGNFSFDEVTPNEAYVIAAESRQYNYASQNLFVAEARNDVNFVPVETRESTDASR